MQPVRQRSFKVRANPNNKDDDSKQEQRQKNFETHPFRSRIYRQPCRNRHQDGNLTVYLLEVHDFSDSKTYGERFWANIRNVTDQNSLEIPLSMVKPLIEHLFTCKVGEEELEHEEDDEKEEQTPVTVPITQFDLDSLENKRFFGLERTFALEITNTGGVKDKAPAKLLTCESLGKDDKPNAGGDVAKLENANSKEDRREFLTPRAKKGSLVITEWFLPRDISIRHMKFTESRPDVRNLYAPSGSRRFFFDIHETQWGARLQISQVTALHRNTISIPLESLVLFRNRLNGLIDKLNLDEFTDLRIAKAPRPRRVRDYESVNYRSRVAAGRPARGHRSMAVRRFRPRGIKPLRSKPIVKNSDRTQASESER